MVLSIALMIAWVILTANQSYVQTKATCSKLQEKLTSDGKLKAMVYREEAPGFDPRELVVVIPASQDFQPQAAMSKSLPDRNEPNLCCLILGRADVAVNWKQNNRLLVSYSLDREMQTIIQRRQVPNMENVMLDYGPMPRSGAR